MVFIHIWIILIWNIYFLLGLISNKVFLVNIIGASLEQTHIFALAHILRRPIIVYGVKYVKSFRGETLGLAKFQGMCCTCVVPSKDRSMIKQQKQSFYEQWSQFIVDHYHEKKKEKQSVVFLYAEMVNSIAYLPVCVANFNVSDVDTMLWKSFW